MALRIPEIEERLAKELEGKLFVCISFHAFSGKSYTIIKTHYTVLSGLVYIIEDKGLVSTGDTLLALQGECKIIGKFDPLKKYKRIVRDYSYKEFKKLHKL
jgi:hypothetical protein